MLKTATILIGALSVLTGASAEETALSKSCLFAVAAQLPPVPGLAIRSASTALASAVQIGGSDPTLHQWNVVMTVEAAGQFATYEALCSAGNKTPPTVIRLAIRENTDMPPPPPAPTPAPTPAVQQPKPMPTLPAGDQKKAPLPATEQPRKQ